MVTTRREPDPTEVMAQAICDHENPDGCTEPECIAQDIIDALYGAGIILAYRYCARCSRLLTYDWCEPCSMNPGTTLVPTASHLPISRADALNIPTPHGTPITSTEPMEPS